MKRYAFVVLIFVLAACTSSTATTTTGAPTAILPTATSNSTLTAAPTPEIFPTITFLPGLTSMEHPGFPGYVFLVDARRWTNDFNLANSPEGRLKFLHYNSIPACRLDAVPAMRLPTPDRMYVKIMRGRVFHIFEYKGLSIYETNHVYFKLEDVTNLECHTTQETLLADIVDAAEFYGGSTSTPFATSTPPPIDGFKCDALTPLLRPGDTAYINTSGVWLRSSPDRYTANGIKLFPKNAPVLFSVMDGPRCSSGHAYWQVSATEVGEGGKTYTGWIAEANTTKYLLLNWNP